MLDALKHECVHATFFLLGRNAREHPQLARRELAEGHSIGHHSYSHPLLNRMTPAKAEAEINRGIAEDELALYGVRRTDATIAVLPLSRFCLQPGAARLPEPARHRGVRRRRLGERLAADDPGAGIASAPQPNRDGSAAASCCCTTPRAQTADMLPALLRELKRRGYRIVHVVPAASHRASN